MIPGSKQSEIINPRKVTKLEFHVYDLVGAEAGHRIWSLSEHLISSVLPLDTGDQGNVTAMDWGRLLPSDPNEWKGHLSFV